MHKVEREYYETLFAEILRLTGQISTDEEDQLGKLEGLAQAGVWMAQQVAKSERPPTVQATHSGG